MRKYKILVVENDIDEQYFIKEAFDATDLFQLLGQLSQGEELFQWLSEHPSALPDVVLSDLNMPGKNGYDILAEMKANPLYAHIPIIIISTSSTPSIIEKCMEAGAAGYLIKPDTFIAYGKFVEKLHALIESEQLVP